MRRAFGLSLLAAAGLLAGCANDVQPFGGRRTKAPPQSIVSLSPGTTEIVASAGLLTQLKGRTSACDFPEYIARSVPVVAGVKPDYESLAEAKPQLIVYDPDLYNSADVAKLKETGAELWAFDPGSIDEYIDKVAEFAAKTGSETTVSTYLDKVESARKVATSDGGEKPKVAVIMGGGGEVAYVSGTKGFLASAIEASGATPVGNPGDTFQPVDPEALATNPPDIVVVPVNAKDEKAALAAVNAVRNDPRLSVVPALKAGRIVPLDADVLLRRGQRVDKLIDGLHRGYQRLRR